MNCAAWKLEEMCDVTDRLGDMMLYRHNEGKAINWLKSKLAKAAKTIARQREEMTRESKTLFASSFDSTIQSSKSSTAKLDISVESVNVGKLAKNYFFGILY